DLGYYALGELLHELRTVRAYEMVWELEQKKLGTISTALTSENRAVFKHIAEDMLTTFLDGRPDIAQAMARALVEYFRKLPTYDIGDHGMYLQALAVLGERDRIEKEMRDGDVRYLPANEIALILGATRPASERPATVDLIYRLSHAAYTERI